MSDAAVVFGQLAEHETQLSQHDQAIQPKGNAENVFGQLATGGETPPKGPTIGPKPNAGGFDASLAAPKDPLEALKYKMTVPLAKGVMGVMDKLREVENMTQEGRKEHPIQAHFGDLANHMEGFLFGNPEHPEAGIGTGKEGMLTNPVTGSLLPGAGGEPAAAGLIRGGVEAGKSVIQGARAALSGGEEGPGLVKQILKGKEVAQEPAKAALSGAVEKGTPNLRATMDKTIAESTKAERKAYDTVNAAAETDLKDLYEYRSKVQDAIDNPANVDREDLLKDKLADVNAKIAAGEAKATRKLVNAPESVKEAEGLTQKRYAQEEVKKKLFNNESVVSGNVEHGAEETINVDAAIKEAEKLNKPSKYAPEGSPTRLEQALGKDGAQKLLRGLYDAQKKGETAMNKKKWAQIIGSTIGVGISGGLVKHAAGAMIQ